MNLSWPDDGASAELFAASATAAKGGLGPVDFQSRMSLFAHPGRHFDLYLI
jgi:hypothetical protein